MAHLYSTLKIWQKYWQIEKCKEKLKRLEAELEKLEPSAKLCKEVDGAQEEKG